MSSPDLERLSLDSQPDSDTDWSIGKEISTDDEVTEYNEYEVTADHEDDNPVGHATTRKAIDKYLRAESDVYRTLQWMRVKASQPRQTGSAPFPSTQKRHSNHDGYQGWKNTDANDYFLWKKLRAEDNPTEAIAELETEMALIAEAMQKGTEAFTIASKIEPKRILDLSVTPGAFLTYALEQNPKAHALAFNLPEEDGGFEPTLEEREAIRIQMLDMTMLAADMGVGPDETSKSKRHAHRFRHNQYFEDGHGSGFDLAICDGTIEPTWGMFRGDREYRRRLLTQLVLGLEHLREGGKMIIQLYKLESIQTIHLIRKFAGFANVTVFKHDLWVGKLSCFYIVASEVRSTSQQARDAVQEWKWEWEVVTLGTKRQWLAERDRLAHCGSKGLESFLQDPKLNLLELGNYVWQKQINLLADPPW